MPIKESSDELNPPERAAGSFLVSARGSRTWRDYLALALATWGVGYLPLAPGTFGSAVGVGIYLLIQSASARAFAFAAGRGWSPELQQSLRTTLILLLIAVLALGGVWAASRTEKLLGRKDPGIVVVDEVVGQLIALLFVPFNSGWWVIIVGFVAFRLFDIWKPYPVRRLESLEAGLGIMADDVLAGAYAAILLSLVMSIYLLL
ncbi:MAG TPA: phosphatidylglycerophosphatase A [Pyrinomonadaceae bacterium]|nr:phosphatidylglycerophosphatase A [Pyrinomonadaceae bacterium]